MERPPLNPLALVPNSLTVLRAILAIAFPFLPQEYWLAVFIISALTEFLDGYLARLLNIESQFGQMLDPIADKAFILSVAGTLLYHGYLTLPILLLASIRDLFVLLCLVVLLVRRRIAHSKKLKPRWAGKITTALQFALLVTLIVMHWAPIWLIVITAVAGTIAAVDYYRAYLALRLDDQVDESS